MPKPQWYDGYSVTSKWLFNDADDQAWYKITVSLPHCGGEHQKLVFSAKAGSPEYEMAVNFLDSAMGEILKRDIDDRQKVV